ncbi:hypothetical protein [Candidatus Avelusimicrobium sp.]
MRKLGLLFLFCLILSPLHAQEAVGDLTKEELSVIEAIKAKNKIDTPQTAQTDIPKPAPTPMQAPLGQSDADENEIKLSQQTKEEALKEQTQNQEPANATDTLAQNAEEDFAEPAEEGVVGSPSKKCLAVAFIDIDIAFNEHPRTQAVKKQIDLKIKSKQREVESAKDIIEALEAENNLLSRQLTELKPFYERIITDQALLPKVPEPADTLLLNNILNRLIFAGTEVLSTTPLNSPARLDDVTERIGANKKIIAERSFFIDNYKYQTREEILLLEQQEVKAILQDIYNEIKSFAKKRNIGAVVRKDEILYGQAPVNVTKDFVNRLKKSKKYRKK